MATSLPPVTLTDNVWVDLYDVTGIVVGTQLIIQNIGSSEALLSESASEPTTVSGYNIIPTRTYLTNTTANIGAWAFSENGTTLQVEEA